MFFGYLRNNMNTVVSLSIFILIVNSVLVKVYSTRPNIVLIVADDLGWDDVSFHGSDLILTPNIDLLAYTGVALSRYYTHSLCTPSRAALLTGKFGYKNGMHGYPLTNAEDNGLPVTEKILPQYLKELGYSTHLVGKWHQGNSRTDYLPTNRGFDTYFGHRCGFIDYYEYVSEEVWDFGRVSGVDMFRNNTPAWDVEGYITHVYTDEAKSIIKSHDTTSPLFLMLAHNAPHSGNDAALLQAPPGTVRAMRHVEATSRRILAAMVKELDDSIGEVISTLSEKGILDNTIIVFISDNGAMTIGDSINYGSNWPLRGEKFTPFEGGIRVPSLIWSPSLMNSNHLWEGYMHVSDWLPTLLSAVSAEKPENIDGLDLWNLIKTNNESARTEIFELGDNEYLAIISGHYKLIAGKLNHTEYCDHKAGDLRAIIGKAPSYTEALTKSKIYKVLTTKSVPIQMDTVNILRNKIRLDCKKNMTDVKLCYPENGSSCLFNIKEDPCETEDLSTVYPEVVARLKTRLDLEMTRLKPRPTLFRDPRALPSKHNFTWATWADGIVK